MGLFSRKKQSGVDKFLLQQMIELTSSPMGLWASAHRARITLGLSPQDSKPSDNDGSIGWKLLSPLVTQTVFYSARQTWLGNTENRDAEIFVLAIMHSLASFLAVQYARLSEEDRLFMELSPMPEFDMEFLGCKNRVEFEMGSLSRNASEAIAQGISTPGGKQFFSVASDLLSQFWTSGHQVDAKKLGDHFKPMLNSVK